jgi:hypothetical protein
MYYWWCMLVANQNSQAPKFILWDDTGAHRQPKGGGNSFGLLYKGSDPITVLSQKDIKNGGNSGPVADHHVSCPKIKLKHPFK